LRGSSLGTQSTTAEAGGKAAPHFAVSLAAPDLRPWLGGNCGIAGAWSFTAPEAGPHLALFALTHGNEIAGAIVLDDMLRAGIRPERGRLSLVFANLAAFQAFDPEKHQAMAEQPAPEGVAPGTVLHGWTSAWTLNGRLLKPAMVVVAKAEG
jgi:hypothetical protein